MAATNSKSAVSEKPVWMITGCSTGFGRKLAKHMLDLVDDNAATAGAWRAQVRAVSGKQPGDAVRAAHAIVKAIASPNPPHRLILGSNAFEGAMAKLEELRKEFLAWESVSRGADIPKDV